MPGGYIFFPTFENKYFIFETCITVLYVYLVVNLFSIICSSIDEAAKEKLAPFSSLTGDESYQSRDLEKVHSYYRCLFSFGFYHNS